MSETETVLPTVTCIMAHRPIFCVGSDGGLVSHRIRIPKLVLTSGKVLQLSKIEFLLWEYSK